MISLDTTGVIISSGLRILSEVKREKLRGLCENMHNFHKMKDESTERSLLRKDTTADEVADVVAFLADTKGGSRGITGQV